LVQLYKNLKFNTVGSIATIITCLFSRTYNTSITYRCWLWQYNGNVWFT